MIQANELRIGNWVLYPHTIHEPFQITEPRHIELAYLLKPIQLTPELLEACGFDAVRPSLMPGYAFYRSKSWDGRHRFRWDNVEGFAMETVGSGWIWHFKDIQYIHQVQNFIFALTGTELSINLEKVKA